MVKNSEKIREARLTWYGSCYVKRKRNTNLEGMEETNDKKI